MAADNLQTKKPGQDLFITDRKQLQEPLVLQRFSELVKDIIVKDDKQEAIEGRFVLEDMLIGQYSELAQQAPEIYAEYQKLITLLKLVSLSARPLTEVEELLQGNLSLAFKSNIPMQQKLRDILDLYDDILMEGKIAQSLARALTNSTEKIGEGNITLKGKREPVSPTLGNFVLDYRQSTVAPPGVYKRAGSLERVTYLNRNQNAHNLSKDAQDTLLRVFELYDWLRFGSPGAVVDEGVSDATDSQAPSSQKLKSIPAPQREKPEIKVAPAPPPVAPSVKIPPARKRPLPSPPKPDRKPAEPDLGRPASPPAIEKLETTAPKTNRQSRIFDSVVKPPVSEKESVQPESKDQLYKSTLDELNKMREQFEKPNQTGGPKAPGKSVGVNEAIIRGGRKQAGDRGEIVAGDKEIEDKLKKLQDKLDQKK